ncbi:hypothetical protein [Natrinema gelatinilyticum]|uniref:hypothetical protein n=1 Tax=Natrinema gelatinilyticum TaxID=2961571 RepID=UPI0020C1BB9D|nr:hypothetical protein [Natrinema gelatinilyticum]
MFALLANAEAPSELPDSYRDRTAIEWVTLSDAAVSKNVHRVERTVLRRLVNVHKAVD